MTHLKDNVITAITTAVCLFIAVAQSIAQGSAEKTTPSATSATEWKQVQLQREGQQAYTAKRFADAYMKLVEFRAANQAIFQSPPSGQKATVDEVNDAIAYCYRMITASSTPAPTPAKTEPAKREIMVGGISVQDHP